MDDQQAHAILKRHASSYGDARYKPARWVVDALQDAVAAERERCAALVTGNYGWRADTKQYCDDLGDMLRKA